MKIEVVRHLYLRRIVGPTFQALGPTAADQFARWMGSRVCRLNTAGRQIAEERLRDALGPEATPERLAAIVSAMYEHIGRFWTESLFLRRHVRESSWRRVVSVDGEASLRSLAEARRGCVLATAYFGNPAAAACALGQLFRPVHVVVDYLAQPALASWQREIYSMRWVHAIDRRGAATEVPRILTSGGAVLLIAEHERRRGPAITVPFLGRLARCYPALDRLPRWFDVPAAVVTCQRRAQPMRFSLVLHEVIEPRTAGTDDGYLARRAMESLAAAIMRRPEQYLWTIDAGNREEVGEVRPVSSAITGMESGSGSSPRRSRTASVLQKPSAAGREPAGSAAAIEPAPTG